jgi:hypothetical protein
MKKSKTHLSLSTNHIFLTALKFKIKKLKSMSFAQKTLILQKFKKINTSIYTLYFHISLKIAQTYINTANYQLLRNIKSILKNKFDKTYNYYATTSTKIVQNIIKYDIILMNAKINVEKTKHNRNE